MNDQQGPPGDWDDEEPPSDAPDGEPALTFGDETGAGLPHWSDPPSADLEGDEVPGGSRLFPGLPDDPNLVDESASSVFGEVPTIAPPQAESPRESSPFAPPDDSGSDDPLDGLLPDDESGDDTAEAAAPSGVTAEGASDDPFGSAVSAAAAGTSDDPFDSAVSAVDEDADTGVLPIVDTPGAEPSAGEPPPAGPSEPTGLAASATVDDAGTQFAAAPPPPEPPPVPVPPGSPVPAEAASAEEAPAGGDEPGTDDLTAWAELDKGPHWREEASDWGDDVGIGSRDPESARIMFGDDEDTPPQAAPMTGDDWSSDAAATAFGADLGQGRDVPIAIITGVGLAAVFLALMWIGPGPTMALVTPLLVLAAAEFFVSVRRVGYRPAVPLGLAAVGGLALAVFWRGLEAYPLVLALYLIAGFAWYIVDADGERPTPNLAITTFGVLWVGVLGSFAALLLSVPTDGTGLLLGAVIATVAYDVGGYVIGRTTGQSRLAPHISPNKTWEGLIGGMIVAVLASTVVLGFIGVAPWDVDTIDAVLLGVVTAVAAPLGDLAQSLVKRDLGVKDMGHLLPGHGGLMDRFDALLFVLPAVWFLSRLVL